MTFKKFLVQSFQTGRIAYLANSKFGIEIRKPSEEKYLQKETGGRMDLFPGNFYKIQTESLTKKEFITYVKARLFFG